MLARVGGARREIRQNTVAGRRCVAVDLIGNSGEENTQLVAAGTGIFVLKNGFSRTRRKNARARRVNGKGSGQPARQAAKLALDDYLAGDGVFGTALGV